MAAWGKDALFMEERVLEPTMQILGLRAKELLSVLRVRLSGSVLGCNASHSGQQGRAKDRLRSFLSRANAGSLRR